MTIVTITALFILQTGAKNGPEVSQPDLELDRDREHGDKTSENNSQVENQSSQL